MRASLFLLRAAIDVLRIDVPLYAQAAAALFLEEDGVMHVLCPTNA